MMNLRLKLTFGLALLALAGCVPANTAQQATQPPEAVQAPAQAYQGAVLPYGLNDAAVAIGANDTVPLMDSTLYQRLGPVCDMIPNNARVANGQRLDVNRWAITWQNNGVRPWDQNRWPNQLTNAELRGIACNIAVTRARIMWSNGTGARKLAPYVGMTAAEIRQHVGGAQYNRILYAWEMANFTYAVARTQGIPVDR